MLKKLAPFILSGFLAACASNAELQKDGEGLDEPRPSPCVGIEGSPCNPIPYDAPSFKWGRV